MIAGDGCETHATVIRSVWPTTSRPAAIPTDRCVRYVASGRAALHLSAPVAADRRTITPKTCARPATNGSENMAMASADVCDYDRIETTHRRALGPWQAAEKRGRLGWVPLATEESLMRGRPNPRRSMLAIADLEERVPRVHPLRRLRRWPTRARNGCRRSSAACTPRWAGPRYRPSGF